MKRSLVFILVILLAAAGCGSREEAAKETPQPELAGLPGLHAAAATGNIDAVKKHIEAGSDLNVKDPEGGACPLSTAALFGQTEVAEALIKAGADVNCRGNDGATPLHVAAFFCREEIVTALLEAGADKTIKNSYQSTPQETVSGPYENVKPVYEHFEKTLGIKLDYERLETARPKIAEMLK